MGQRRLGRPPLWGLARAGLLAALALALPALALPGAPARSAPGSRLTPSISPGAADPPAASVSIRWAKPAPRETRYVAEGIDCGPSGGGGDRVTNLRKNRVDVPGECHPVEFRAVSGLPFPHAPRSRARWSRAQLAAIAPYEGVAVRVAGYLADLRVEGPERTNCGMRDSADVDWHLWLTRLPNEPKRNSIVVETTPRVRRSHPLWTPEALAPWVRSGRGVRISGWLMFDPDHPDQVGLTRATLWEIHPITRIEVEGPPGSWTDLDSLGRHG